MFVIINQSRIFFKGLWCNGNTSDFGPDIPSSNLGRPTKNLAMFKKNRNEGIK